MKRMLFIALVSFIAFSSNVMAKNDANAEAKAEVNVQTSSTALKGMVFDKLTNEKLAGAIVTANGQKVYTDLDGNFTINNVCSGKCEVKISLISYEDQTIEIDTKRSNTLEVELSQR